MTNRIIDISDHPARLSASGGLLRIEMPNAETKTVPFSQIAALVCSHGQVSLTQAAVAQLAGENGILIVCNQKHLPVAMALPIIGHGEQTARFAIQASAKLPLRKRLWRQIVEAKIRAQGKALALTAGMDGGFSLMARRVRVSNATEMEARASRVYWSLLFEDRCYRRGNEEDARNSLLDYGYAVVRALVARALCSAGLHPGLPLHHHNKYDPFPLANDVMEPFRPLVDIWVRLSWAVPFGLNRQTKGALLSWLTDRFSDGSQRRTLFDWAGLMAERLARCLERKRVDMDIPELYCGESRIQELRSVGSAERIPGNVVVRDV